MERLRRAASSGQYPSQKVFVLKVMSHSGYDLDNFERVANQMSTAAQDAVTTLNQLLLSQSETVRLQAARCLLQCLRLRDALEVEHRVADW